MERLNQALTRAGEIRTELMAVASDLLDDLDTIIAAARVLTWEQVEVCEPHFSMWLNDDDGCEAALAAQVKPWRDPCRKTSMLVIDPQEV